MKKIIGILFLYFLSGCMGTQKIKTSNPYGINLITLDPGHFHAALVQKTMYSDVDSVVHIYAPDGPDLQLHQTRINSYNTRNENPTKWKQEVHTGNDFMEKMLSEKKGNVVVMVGQ